MAKEQNQRFGARLAEFRKAAGFTQETLAEQIGISRRALAYYETQAGKPPDGELLLKISEALRVSVDRLLGTNPVRPSHTRKNPRIMRKLEQAARLPKNDQKAILRHIDALLKTAEA